jgi:hypothetical protein
MRVFEIDCDHGKEMIEKKRKVGSGLKEKVKSAQVVNQTPCAEKRAGVKG